MLCDGIRKWRRGASPKNICNTWNLCDCRRASRSTVNCGHAYWMLETTCLLITLLHLSHLTSVLSNTSSKIIKRKRIYLDHCFCMTVMFSLDSSAAILSFIPGQSLHRRQGAVLRGRNRFSARVPTFPWCCLQGLKGKMLSFIYFVSNLLYLGTITEGNSFKLCASNAGFLRRETNQ